MTVGAGYGEAGGYGVTGIGRAQMRASTADRDRAVELLNRAYTDGRLSKDEHDARMERAMTATTFADLDAVVVDLPGGAPAGPAVHVAAPRTNALAVASLACGIGQVMLWIFATIPAIIMGHMARRQIRRTGEAGDGMALAGLIMGWAGLALQVLLVIGTVLLAVALVHSGPAAG
jgi:hypothetical protein